MKNKKLKLPQIFILILFLLTTLSSALVINPPDTPRDFTSEGTYYHSSGNNAYFATNRIMTFSQVIVNSTYVMFNNTGFNITSPERINVSIDYIRSSMVTTHNTSLVIFYAETPSGTVHFNISGFSSGSKYYVYRDNVSYYLCTANATGVIHFSSSVWSTKYFEIKGWDTTSPTIEIKFAGNMSDNGGPYWRPPGESDILDEAGEGIWRDGYYTNNSKQSEDWIYINLTVTDLESDVTDVWLQWLNETTWTEYTYAFVNTVGDFWEYNTSGNIQTCEGYNYSFNIVANSSGGSKTQQWYKTGPLSNYKRRFIQLNCSQVDISYIPLYFNNATYGAGEMNKKDRLHCDQGIDGGLHDTGYLWFDTPTNITQNGYCGSYVGYWFDSPTCIQSPFTLQNIYYHLWWSSNNDEGGNTFYSRLSWRENRGTTSYNGNNLHTISNLTGVSHIVYDDGIDGTNNNHSLNCQLWDVTDTDFTDNSIYELCLTMQIDNTPVDCVTPNIISNRSYPSFIILNVPSNASLGATDSDSDGLTDIIELYTTHTNPFFCDTDNDGYDDDVEYSEGSDPNNYTDFPATIPWSNTAPTLTNEIPSNSSTEIKQYPQLNVTVTDADGNTSTVCFWSNSTGSWIKLQQNDTIVNATVRVMNFTVADTPATKYWWKVTANDGNANVSAIYYFTTLADTNYIYAGGTATQKTYQYYRSNLTKKAETLDYGGTIYGIVEDNNYIYVVGDTTQKVYQYWKSNMTKKAESADYGGTIFVLYCDDTYIYVGGGTTQKVYQYYKSNLTKKSESADYGAGIGILTGDSTYIYAAGSVTQKVYQYWKSNMTKKAESADYGGTISGLAEDNLYVYAGGATTQKVYQYWKSNMTKKAESIGYGGSINQVIVDDTYVYCAGFTTRKVYQYWKSNMTKKAETANYGGTIITIAQDGNYVYAGGATTQKVYQYWKSNMTKKDETLGYGGNIYTISANLSVDSYTVPPPTPWSNTAPTLTLETPTNGSTSISRWPSLSVKVTDADGNQSKVYWYTNATGPWTLIQTNNGILNSTITKTNFTQADSYNTKYWWRVSANDTHDNTTETYYFTTLVFSSNISSVPYNFVAEWITDASINMSWTVSGTNKTVIVRKIGSYPSSPADGVILYNGTGLNDTDFTASISEGWTDMYFPEYIFTQNSSISANHTIENFLEQCGVWGTVDLIFYDDPVEGLISWWVGDPINELENITYDAANPYIFHATGPCTLSLLLDNVSGGTANYFHDVGLDNTIRYYYRAWSLSGTVFSANSTKIILAYSGSPNNVEETTANISGYLVTDKPSTVRVLYGYTTAYGTNSTNITTSSSGYTNFTLTGLTRGHIYHYITYSNDSGGNITYGYDPFFFTKPEAPTNASSDLNFGTLKINLSWDGGLGANRTVIVSKATGYPNSPSDGTIIYNGTGEYTLYSFVLGNSYYFKAWSFSSWITPSISAFSDNGTTFSINGTGGLFINCYDETTDENLTFNVKISNKNGSQVYENTGCTNTHAINETLCPQGPKIQIIISATGYQQRLYTLNIYAGMIYVLNAYLPPVTPPGNGTIYCVQRPYIDSAIVLTPVTDAIIALTHEIDDIINVEVYNTSLYGTYGGWLFVPSSKYSYNATAVVVNQTVLDLNTTMVRVNYYYLYCTGDIASALYNINVVETITTEYGSNDRRIEDALVIIKRYISSSGKFVEVSSLYTDANGNINIYLIPNVHYKVFISKTGYIDTIGDYIPSDSVFSYTFRLYPELPDIPSYDSFFDVITFKATMNENATILIEYCDSNKTTVNTTINLYNLSGINNNRTLINSTFSTSDCFSYYVYGIDRNLTHLVKMWFNNTATFDIESPVTLMVLAQFNDPHAFDIDDRIKKVIGPAEFVADVGWHNVIAFMLPLILLVSFGVYNTTLGIFAFGTSIGLVQGIYAIWLTNAINPLLIALCPIAIAIGIIYAMTTNKAEGGL